MPSVPGPLAKAKEHLSLRRFTRYCSPTNGQKKDPHTATPTTPACYYRRHPRRPPIIQSPSLNSLLIILSTSAIALWPCHLIIKLLSFLCQHKNGLFKKAYELGVLCSVDVAVIIFEERPGHHVKLYQYGSTDIHDVVQRHLRYDGEKDTKGPADFSGNPKLEDIGEADDDDVDEDDHQDMHNRAAKRRGDGKLKPDFGKSSMGNDLGMNVDMEYSLRHPMTIPPPPMPLHHPSQLPPTSSLPISSDRHSMSGLRSSASHHSNSGSNKKPRTSPSININTHSRSSSDDPTSAGGGGGGGGGGGYGYHGHGSPTTNSSGFRPPPQNQPHYNVNNAFFNPVSTPPPPPSFIPGAFDFNHPTSSSRRSTFPPPPPRYGDQNQQGQGQGMYQQLIRQQQHHHSSANHHPHSSNSAQPPPPAPPPAGPDLFAAFLDADEHNRQQVQNQSQPFPGLDWPVHAQGQQPQAVQAPPGSAGSAPGGAESNWLDFLSGAPPPPSSATTASSSGREPMSWERDRPLPDMFSGGGRGGGSNVTSPRMKNRDTNAPSSKRSRVSSTGTAEGSGDGDEGGGGGAGGSPSVNGSGGSGSAGGGGGRKDDVKVEPAKIKGEVG